MDFEALEPSKRLEFIEKAVADFKSKELKAASEPLAYYDTKNPDITKRRKMYASSITEKIEGDSVMRAVAKENKFAANEKIASSFFRDITDSKAQYLAGEGADVNAVSGEDADNKLVKAVTDALAEQIKRHGQACLTDALVFKAGYAYMQVINDQIRLSYVPYCEVKPYRDRTDALTNVLRYYKRNGCEYAEFHTKAKIYAFKNTGDDWEFEDESPQIQRVKVYGDGTTEVVEGGKGWARLPWFELWHNNDHTSSLTNAAKTMIRCYDITLSDFANNLIDVQDVFISLKDSYGSGGDWGEQLELLKNFKIGENVEGVTTFEVPHVARETLLSMLKADIYAALRGVDVGRISGGNLTNTAIRALYSDIDLWADQAEWHVKDWVRDIIDTAAAYMGLALPPYKVTLTRRAIFDDVAQMDALSRQKGVISDKTIYENHPLVTDAQSELERVNAQELDAAYSEGL